MSDDFDDLLESYRIHILECVKTLFRLAPYDDQRQDFALSHLNLWMVTTLEELRAKGPDPPSPGSDASESPRDGLTGLGMPSVGDLGFNAEDADFEQYINPSRSGVDELSLNSRLDIASHPMHSAGHFPVPSTCHSSDGVSPVSTPFLSTSTPSDDEQSGPDNGSGLVVSSQHATRATRPENGRTTTVPRQCPNDVGQIMKSLLSDLVGDGEDTVGGPAVFRDFCDAVKFIRCQQVPRLPPEGGNIDSFLVFFSAVKGARFAFHLLHRVGSWRFLKQYDRLKNQKKEQREQLSNSEKRSRHAGKPASQARSALMTTERAPCSGSPPTLEKSSIQLDNRIEASKVWYMMCQLAGPALAAMIPNIPRTKLQRLGIEDRQVLVNALIGAHHGLQRVVKAISPHLEAILEGGECWLGTLIEEGKLQSFSDVFSHDELALCTHSDGHPVE